MENSAYLYALGANLAFALGVQFFTRYSRTQTSVWVNCFKVAVATPLFLLAALLAGGLHAVSPLIGVLFCLSGAIGLGLGDIYLLKSFVLMGPGRTLLLFGFQPLVVGCLSFFLFGQPLDSRRLLAVVFFIVCVAIFSVEARREKGHWEVRAFVFALAGMCLDGLGVIITRYSFDRSPDLSTVEGNFYRGLGAVAFFVVLARVRPFDFVGRWRRLRVADRSKLVLGSFLGTFLSLLLYLQALRSGHLAGVTGIAVTGVIFASFFECVLEGKAPSRYMWLSFGSFLAGMWLLFRTP